MARRIKKAIQEQQAKKRKRRAKRPLLRAFAGLYLHIFSQVARGVKTITDALGSLW